MTLVCGEIFESAHHGRAAEYVCQLCENQAHLEIIRAVSFEWSPGRGSFCAELSLNSVQSSLWRAVAFQFLTWAVLGVIRPPWCPGNNLVKSLIKQVK